MRSLALLVLLVPGVASAAPAEAGAVAVAVNSPTSWPTIARAGSLYVAINEHQALRANVAQYGSHNAQRVIMAVVGADGDDSHEGGHVDVGVSWMYFLDRVWNGASLEAGLLRRASGTEDFYRDTYTSVDRDTTLYAARAMVGTTWPLFRRHAFIAVATGLAVGYESGTETEDSPDAMPISTRVGKLSTSAELYLRFGVVLR